jgi:hypothetical protein
MVLFSQIQEPRKERNIAEQHPSYNLIGKNTKKNSPKMVEKVIFTFWMCFDRMHQGDYSRIPPGHYTPL